MAHHHLLPLILPLVLLILPSSTHATTKAMFTEPLQLLFGGQNLTDGDLTLSLSNDCSLILYKDGIPAKDFNTSTTTSSCALLVTQNGQLDLVPDNELTPTQTIGKKTYPGRYALLFINGNLGIFGPAMWDNGSTDYILFSGNYVTGSGNGDVVIAQNGKVSTVITKKCALAVKDDSANKTIWHSWPTSDEPTECFLELKSNGQLLLQRYNESGVVTQWKGGYAAKDNLYVCLLRYYGGITIYGLKTWLYHDGSSSSSAAAAAAAVVAEKIKMVTA
ncbi:uncharacterized protein LOC120270742 [Dioscorea cayenensis subsp. rotundata]|uniref:Uncharacterized protein LOC120270742 n=1 Tax=Dioscorea cayennensis subsp. rotundata TaxID=55577 RepID=A0AB40C1W4_DIOCR|nr:uncharacterized protein LOC120270742 [Dioscorea cayenensis subsp. rotundata]